MLNGCLRNRAVLTSGICRYSALLCGGLCHCHISIVIIGAVQARAGIRRECRRGPGLGACVGAAYMPIICRDAVMPSGSVADVSDALHTAALLRSGLAMDNALCPVGIAQL